MSFADNVRRLRTARGLQQKDVADALGVPPPRISEIERSIHSNPKLTTIRKFAEFFGVSYDELLSTNTDEEVDQ